MGLSSDEIQAFAADGFLVKRKLFGDEEIELLQEALRTDDAIRKNAFAVDDREGDQTVVAVWSHPSDDTLGIVPRLARIAESMTTLLGGEVYHYHTKVTSKVSEGGGTWEWHQDYGYWYKNGILFPHLASVAIALSELTIENGTLRVLRGSHAAGRIEHLITGGQNGADAERVGLLVEALEEVTFVAKPGDALFFHCNTLHASAPNVSDSSRDILLCCFNRADNDPRIKHHHPSYTPLEIVDDETLLRIGLKSDGFERSFMDPADDISIGEYDLVTMEKPNPG